MGDALGIGPLEVLVGKGWAGRDEAGKGKAGQGFLHVVITRQEYSAGPL